MARNDSELVVTLTIGELRELLRGTVEQALDEHDRQPAPRLLDARGLAQQLRVSVSSVHRLAREGMPYTMVGELRRFEVEACVAWLAKHPRRAHLRGLPGGKP